MRKGNAELTDIEAQIVAETALAWKLDDGKTREWVPKSLVENNNDGTFTMPSYLAIDKGFA